MRIVYANSRAWRVRLLQWGFWAVAALFLALGLLIVATDADWDAGALLILSPIMAAIALGMELYRSLYVTRIAVGEAGVEVETLGFRGRRSQTLAWEDLAVPRHGAWNARGQVSTAAMLRRPGARLPWIIDTTDDAFDERALGRGARR